MTTEADWDSRHGKTDADWADAKDSAAVRTAARRGPESYLDMDGPGIAV